MHCLYSFCLKKAVTSSMEDNIGILITSKIETTLGIDVPRNELFLRTFIFYLYTTLSLTCMIILHNKDRPSPSSLYAPSFGALFHRKCYVLLVSMSNHNTGGRTALDPTNFDL